MAVLNTDQSKRTTRAALRANLSAHFSVDEMQLLADDFGVDFAGLPGDGKEVKALHLIKAIEAQGKAPALLARCRVLRPEVAWGDDIARWDEVKPYVLIGMVLVAVFGATLAAYIALVPAQMPAHAFNVAVADFGELDAGGEGRASTSGAQLAASVYQRLDGALNALPDAIKIDRRPLVWFDGMSLLAKRSRIGVIAGNSEAALRDNAARRANDLNANLLIYGNYEAVHDDGIARGKLTPAFYIRADSRDADEITGRHQLGRPITIRLDGESIAGNGASSALRTRQEALSRIAIALLYDANGSNDRALDFLKQADVDLPRSEWPDQDGREILYYLIGREALLLSSTMSDESSALRLLDEAAASFRRALAINADYPAARLTLAGTQVQQATWLAKRPFAAVDWAGIALTATHAISSVLEAQSLKGAEESPPFHQKAQATLGDAHRLLGVAQARLGQFAAARENLDEAVQLIELELQRVDAQQTRFRAQLHLLLGVAYHERARLHKIGFGDVAASAADYQKAEMHYNTCIDDPAANDDIYVGRLRDMLCSPYLVLLAQER